MARMVGHSSRDAVAEPPGAPRPTAGRVWEDVVGLLVAGLWTLALAGLVIVGADAMWAVALGDHIRAAGSVPDGLPFAAAPTAGWHNSLVLGELALSVVAALGDAGLAVFQLTVVGLVLALTALETRRLGASPTRQALVVSVVVVGALAALVVMRLPVFSLALYPFLLALLRREHDHPTWRIWLAVGAIAVWANLHGGVLVGACLLLVHLGLSRWRRRPAESLAAAVLTLLALCATPALGSTASYYVTVFDNEAARRGTDLWAGPSLVSPLDLLMLGAVLVLLILVGRAGRRSLPLWEAVVLLGLLAGTAMAARNGVWLLLTLGPAAGRRATSARSRPGRLHPLPLAGLAAVVIVASGLVVATRGAAVAPQGTSELAVLRRLVGTRVVLATEPLAETLARGGIVVWASNPIDAFGREDQAAYLDFLHDGRLDPDAMADVAVVVVPRGEVVDPGGRSGRTWRLTAAVGGYDVYERAG